MTSPLFIKIPVDIGEDPDLEELSGTAEHIWIRAQLPIKRRASDGVFTAAALRRELGGKYTPAEIQAAIAELVGAGLWEPADPDYELNGPWTDVRYLDDQPTRAAIEAKQSARAEASAKGNHVRHHIKKGIQEPSCELCFPSVLPVGIPTGEQSDSQPSPTTNTEGLPPSSEPEADRTPIGSPETETETETETTRSVLNSRPKGSDSEPTSEQFEMVARWGPNAHEVDNVQKANPGFDVAAATRRFVDWHASTERTGLDNQRTHDEWMGLWRGWIRRDLAKFNAPVAAGYHKAPPPVEDHRTPDVDVSGKIASARTALNTSEMSTA